MNVGAYESLTDQGLERYPGLQPSGCQVVTSSSTPVLIVCSKLLLEEVFSVFNQHLLQTNHRAAEAGDARGSLTSPLATLKKRGRALEVNGGPRSYKRCGVQVAISRGKRNATEKGTERKVRSKRT
jgi:hypothetical protein